MEFNQTLCLACASIVSLKNYNPDNGDSNPWKNYYQGNFNEDANGGWSSPLRNEQRECPSVTFNRYLNCYTLTANGYNSSNFKELYIHVDETDNLTQWSEGLRMDLLPVDLENPYYAYFVNKEGSGMIKGSVTECGQDAFLYYLSDGSSISHKTSRIPVQFN